MCQEMEGVERRLFYCTHTQMSSLNCTAIDTVVDSVLRVDVHAPSFLQNVAPIAIIVASCVLLVAGHAALLRIVRHGVRWEVAQPWRARRLKVEGLASSEIRPRRPRMAPPRGALSKAPACKS